MVPPVVIVVPGRYVEYGTPEHLLHGGIMPDENTGKFDEIRIINGIADGRVCHSRKGVHADACDPGPDQSDGT